MTVETNTNVQWVAACAPDDIDEEDVKRIGRLVYARTCASRRWLRRES
jgi:hypothetical protein